MYEGVWTYISCYLWSGMILLDMCPFFRWNGSSPREYLVMGIQPLTKVTPSSSQGKWWTCYITSPWDPPLGIPDLRRVGQERSRRFFRRTTRGSSAPWRCLVTILVATPRLKKGHYPRGCTLPKTIILMRCKRRVIYFEARRRLRKPQRLFHVVGPRV